MSRDLSLATLAVGLAFATTGLASRASGTISGTVTVSGATSNANAVVYVTQVAGTLSKSTTPAQLDQSKMQFSPHVLAIVAGTSVKFLNGDPTAHNVFSPDNEKYNLGTWPQGQTKDYVFDKCQTFPCVYRQLCRVHPEMLGYIVVLQNPYFAVTAKDGTYEIKDVPPGSYQLDVWHEKAKASPQPVTVDATKPAVVNFTLKK